MAILSRNLLIITLITMLGTAIAQEVPDISLMKTLPINLDAESSEFDRMKNKLHFRSLTIKQGLLSIKADEATATRLDFEDMRWEFTGTVIIENASTTARCDYADILFREHRISSVVMRGQPVTFQQLQIEEQQHTKGHANLMEYNVDSGIIKMTDDAWLSDGANEVSGNRISYDLIREYIIADADDDGQVRMRIIPPEDSLPDIGDQIKP